MKVGQEMGAVLQETMKIGVAVQRAQVEVGLDKPKMEAIQAKMEAGHALSDAEKAQVRALGVALGPALASIDGELTEVGRTMATKISEQFAQLVKSVT